MIKLKYMDAYLTPGLLLLFEKLGEVHISHQDLSEATEQYTK